MTADLKLRAIKSILSNEAYQIDCGLYQRAEAGLNKLSLDVLNALSVIIDQKVHDCAERVRRDLAPVGSFLGQ